MHLFNKHSVWTTVCILFGCVSVAHSETQIRDAENDAWRVDIAPYIWAVNMNGRVQVANESAHVNQSTSDIFDNLNWGGMLWADVHKGRWGIFANAMYAVLSNDTTVDDGYVSVDSTNDFGLFSAGISYAVVSHYFGSPCGINTNGLIIEPYLGARYTVNDTTVTVAAPGFYLREKEDQNWTDPIVGARVTYIFNDAWSAVVAGDVGGTNANDHYSYNATALVGYTAHGESLDTTIYAGYRSLKQHYATGSGDDYFDWDMRIFGPMLGVSLSF